MIELLLTIFGAIVLGLAFLLITIALSSLSILFKGLTLSWDVVLKERFVDGSDFVTSGMTFKNASEWLDTLRAVRESDAREFCSAMYMRPRISWSYEKAIEPNDF